MKNGKINLDDTFVALPRAPNFNAEQSPTRYANAHIELEGLLTLIRLGI